MRWFFIALVRLYQILISPWIGNNCRFIPSCSQYSLECLQKHGTLKGLWLTTCRVSRCRPGCPGGVDPTP